LLIELTALPAGQRYCDDVARAMWEYIRMDIAGTTYDTFTPEWMHVRDQLWTPMNEECGEMTGQSPSIDQLKDWATASKKYYLPLPFWCFDHDRDCYPTVATHLTSLKIKCKTLAQSAVVLNVAGTSEGTATLTDGTHGEITNVQLFSEIVYLEEPERQHFASTKQDYLVNQVQIAGPESLAAGLTSYNFTVPFNHPIKEFIMVFRQQSKRTTSLNYFDFRGDQTDDEAFSTMTVTINNNNRFDPQPPVFFRVLQNREHHSRIPRKHIYTYSFAMDPEDTGPTGTINLSRIETTKLKFTFSTALSVAYDFFLFGRNINQASLDNGVMRLIFAS